MSGHDQEGMVEKYTFAASAENLKCFNQKVKYWCHFVTWCVALIEFYDRALEVVCPRAFMFQRCKSSVGPNFSDYIKKKT